MNRVGVPSTWPEARPLSTSWRIRHDREAADVIHRADRGELSGLVVDELILVIRSPGELADLEHVQAEPLDLREHAV